VDGDIEVGLSVLSWPVSTVTCVTVEETTKTAFVMDVDKIED